MLIVVLQILNGRKLFPPVIVSVDILSACNSICPILFDTACFNISYKINSVKMSMFCKAIDWPPIHFRISFSLIRYQGINLFLTGFAGQQISEFLYA